jgi:excisionase family DNA binding protein
MNQPEALSLELQALIKKSDRPVYSVEDVAAILDCTPSSIEIHLRSGLLPGPKFGRKWVLPKEAFHRHLNDLAVIEATARSEGLAKARRHAIVAIQVTPRPQRGRARLPPDLTRYITMLDSLK